MAIRTKTLLSVQPVAERGGSDQALLRLCRLLVADGWEPHVVFPGPSPLGPQFVGAGAKVHQVPMKRLTRSEGNRYWLVYALSWPVSVLRVWCLARRIRPDVLHSNSLHCWYGWAVASLLRVPHVWHAREIVVQSKVALWLEKKLVRRFAWRAVAISSAVATQFDSSNVVVLHDFIGEEEAMSPERAGRWRAEEGIADDVCLVGAAGRVDTWKGFDVLLKAFPRVRAQRPDAELAIAGVPVPGKAAYATTLAAVAAGTEGVHWLGPRENIADFMADLDLFVLPSTEPEPLGLSALEALASGLAVVATKHGGFAEVLGLAPPDKGSLVPPSDPGALAEAIVASLPEGPSSTERRRARTAVQIGDAEGLRTLFNEGFEHSRSHRHRPSMA